MSGPKLCDSLQLRWRFSPLPVKFARFLRPPDPRFLALGDRLRTSISLRLKWTKLLPTIAMRDFGALSTPLSHLVNILVVKFVQETSAAKGDAHDVKALDGDTQNTMGNVTVMTPKPRRYQLRCTKSVMCITAICFAAVWSWLATVSQQVKGSRTKIATGSPKIPTAPGIGSLPPKTLGKSRAAPQNPAEPRRTLGETPAEPSERPRGAL